MANRRSTEGGRVVLTPALYRTRITHLRRDPLDRDADAFWTPTKTPIPPGFLAGR